MGEPNPSAKWSKYAIAEDGTLERKAEICPVEDGRRGSYVVKIFLTFFAGCADAFLAWGRQAAYALA